MVNKKRKGIATYIVIFEVQQQVVLQVLSVGLLQEFGDRLAQLEILLLLHLCWRPGHLN
jgi:hypothetical protein